MMQSCSVVRCAPLGWGRRAKRIWDATRGPHDEVSLPFRSSGYRIRHYTCSVACVSRLRPGEPSAFIHPPSRQFQTSRSLASGKLSAHVSLTDTLSEQIRSVMRLLTHPVVVLTAHDGTHPRAMTMSSFTSLALSPTPLVTFNIATPSRSLDTLCKSPEFNIHVLAGNERGAEVAGKFTKGNTEDVFQGVEYKTKGLAPALDCDGVLYVLRCRLAKEDAPEGALMRVRDHVIIAAEVLEVIPRSGTDEFGLAYADRRYRQTGDVISRR